MGLRHDILKMPVFISHVFYEHVLLFSRENTHVPSTTVYSVPGLLRPGGSSGTADRPALTLPEGEPVSQLTGTPVACVHFLHNLISLDNDSWRQA